MRHTRWLQELYWVCPICGLKISDVDFEVTRGSDDEGFIAECPQCTHESVV